MGSAETPNLLLGTAVVAARGERSGPSPSRGGEESEVAASSLEPSCEAFALTLLLLMMLLLLFPPSMRLMVLVFEEPLRRDEARCRRFSAIAGGFYKKIDFLSKPCDWEGEEEEEDFLPFLRLSQTL